MVNPVSVTSSQISCVTNSPVLVGVVRMIPRGKEVSRAPREHQLVPVSRSNRVLWRVRSDRCRCCFSGKHVRNSTSRLNVPRDDTLRPSWWPGMRVPFRNRCKECVQGGGCRPRNFGQRRMTTRSRSSTQTSLSWAEGGRGTDVGVHGRAKRRREWSLRSLFGRLAHTSRSASWYPARDRLSSS